MSLHRKMIILRLLHPRHIVQPIHKSHRRMYLRDRTVLSVCSRQIRCRNSLLLFGKPPQYHCLNIFPMVSNQEFEHCQYSHHYSFHHSRQEQKSLSKLPENRIKFSYSFFDTSYEFRFIDFIVPDNYEQFNHKKRGINHVLHPRTNRPRQPSRHCFFPAITGRAAYPRRTGIPLETAQQLDRPGKQMVSPQPEQRRRPR